MSIGILNNKLQNSENVIEFAEDYINISSLSIPFSTMVKKKLTPDIYNGEEIISFNDREKNFKDILINEFLME